MACVRPLCPGPDGRAWGSPVQLSGVCSLPSEPPLQRSEACIAGPKPSQVVPASWERAGAAPGSLSASSRVILLLRVPEGWPHPRHQAAPPPRAEAPPRGLGPAAS